MKIIKLDKEKVIYNKKKAIRELNNMLEGYINSNDETLLKKANLLSYWLKQYADYVLDEKKFNVQRIISYKRGDILKLDFGFNVGSEWGGLHYAVVIENNNPHSSSVVTVLPLTSGTEEDVHNRDLYIGKELYTKLNLKYKTVYDETKKRLAELKEIFSSLNDQNDEKVKVSLDTTAKRIIKVEKEVTGLEKMKKEIERLKEGSIVCVDQITTISKQRIYTPKNIHDVLYGIKLEEPIMKTINDRMVDLFIFKNSEN